PYAPPAIPHYHPLSLPDAFPISNSLPLGPLDFQQAAKRNARQRFSSRHIRARKRVFLSTLLLHWFAKTPPAGLHWNERFYGCVAPQIRSAFARLRSPQVCL